MSHHYCIYLPAVDRDAVLADIELPLVDLAGNLLGAHSVSRRGQEIYYGFFELHYQRMTMSPAISAAGIARSIPMREPFMWNQ